MTDLKTLKELAQAVKAAHWVPMVPLKEDFAYIEAASPQTIIALIDRYERAVEVIKTLVGQSDLWTDEYGVRQRTESTNSIRARDFLKGIGE